MASPQEGRGSSGSALTQTITTIDPTWVSPQVNSTGHNTEAQLDPVLGTIGVASDGVTTRVVTAAGQFRFTGNVIEFPQGQQLVGAQLGDACATLVTLDSASGGAPAEGTLLYYHNGEWYALAVGTVGQVLAVVAGDPAWTSAPTVSGELTASDFKPSGLSGATSASRYVGATASGAPTSGTFAVGDYVIDQTGKLWICTAAGTPGTWTQGSPLTTKGDLYGHSTVDARVPVGADGTFLGADSSQATGLSYKFPAGIAGVSTLSTALSADVTMTNANQYYDGPSLSLTAGTWLLIADLTFYNASVFNYNQFTVRIWDGAITYNTAQTTERDNSSVTSISVCAVVAPTSTTTYRAAAASTVAGSLIKAATLNNAAGNTASSLYAVQLTGAPASGPGALMPAVRAYNSGTQSIVGGSATVVLAFDSTDYDQGTVAAQHSITTNTSRLTCQQAGVYDIVAGVGWLNQSSTGQRVLGLRINGSTIIADDWTLANVNYFIDQTVSAQYRLNVGDYVEAFVLQDSGGTLTISPSAASPTFLSMARLDSGPGAVQPNTKVQLDYAATTDIANGVVLTANTWTTVGSAQTFNVDDANSVIDIAMGGLVFIGDGFNSQANGTSCEVGSRILIDGTTAKQLGGDFLINNSIQNSTTTTGQGRYLNALNGANTISVTGLSAGVHTVALQVQTNVGLEAVYCRASTKSGFESLQIRVLERKQSSSPPSGTPAPAVRCYNSTDISVANTTFQTLSFDTNRFDQGTSSPQHSTVTNASRLTCQQAGVYQITGSVEFLGSASGAYRMLVILLNGITQIARTHGPFLTGAGVRVEVTTAWKLVQGDYVELQAYQDSGGALNVVYTGGYSPEFMMARLDTGALPSYQAQTKTASYTLTPADASFPVLVDATSGSLTITLPTAVGATQMYQVKKLDSSANTVTVATTASQTIDGTATYVISTQYEAVTLVSNGSQWFIF